MPELPTTLSAKERARFDTCKQTIKAGLQYAFDTGAALIEIRDRKYYRDEFETFEAFCQETYRIGRSTAYQLIDAAEVRESLPPETAKMITNEAQARALSTIPEDRRSEVIKQIKQSGEPITAQAIKEAALNGKMSAIADKDQSIESGKSTKTITKNGAQKRPQELDRTGYPIPDRIIDLWHKTEGELGEITRQVSKVRSEIRKIMEEDGENPVWRRVNANSVMIALDNAYREVNAGIPFGVCPYCQGQVASKCTGCKQVGFLGKFDWGAVPKDLLAIREKSCKK